MGNYWCTYTFIIDGEEISVVAKDSNGNESIKIVTIIIKKNKKLLLTKKNSKKMAYSFLLQQADIEVN